MSEQLRSTPAPVTSAGVQVHPAISTILKGMAPQLSYTVLLLIGRWTKLNPHYPSVCPLLFFCFFHYQQYALGLTPLLPTFPLPRLALFPPLWPSASSSQPNPGIKFRTRHRSKKGIPSTGSKATAQARSIQLY